MKYLSNYVQQAQSDLLKELGVIFACSNKQFNEQANNDEKYEHCGAGAYCPVQNVKKFYEGLENIYKVGMQRDLEENGKDAIIERELSNYECYYSCSYEDALPTLLEYGFTVDDIKSIYFKTRHKYDD